MREKLSEVVARLLGAKASEISDDTDISSLNETTLIMEALRAVGYAPGGAGGFPKTFGEFVAKTEEVERLSTRLNKIIIQL